MELDADGEPTSYETPDSPPPTAIAKTDSQLVLSQPPEQQSESLILESFDSEAARKKFDEKTLSTTNINFDDLKIKGWHSFQRPESKYERLLRLRRELEECRMDDRDHTNKDLLAEVDGLLNPAALQVTDVHSSEKLSPPQLQPIKVSNLEARVTRLETRLRVTSEVDLENQIELLQVKLNTITASPGYIDDVAEKLGKLNILAKEIEASDIGSRFRVASLSLDHIHSKASILPSIIERLRSLQQVHENAADVREHMEAIRSSINARSLEIAEWEESIAKLENSVHNTVPVLQNNVNNIKTMITDLTGKLTT